MPESLSRSPGGFRCESQANILDALRHGTTEQHRQIETNPLMHRLQGEQLTVLQYRHTLCRLYGFYQPFEEEVLAAIFWQGQTLDVEQRRKTALLEADLEALGISSAERKTLPLCSELPIIANRAQALGALYVMEGATLGGQVIMRCLLRSLGSEITDACHFYRGYGQDHGAAWQRFRRYCLVQPWDENNSSEAVSTAQATFSHLDSWMREAAS